MSKVQDTINNWINDNDSTLSLILIGLELKELPILPFNIQQLYINNNLLTNIDNLSSLTSLKRLYCSNNLITSLDNLPPSLEELYCDNNKITRLNLNYLPLLKELYCNNNLINSSVLVHQWLEITDLNENQYSVKMNSNKQFKYNFDLFYKENINKCFMNPENTYPINYKQLQKICNNEQFNIYFIKYLTHISFTDFYKQLQKICNNLLLKIKQNNYKYIILVISGYINKSNLWVSLLSYTFLKDKITHITSSKDSFNLFNILNTTNVLFIHPDDCSYSGEQLLEQTNFSGIHKALFNNSNYYILCPYISKTSINKIKIYKLMYPEDVIIFYNINDYMKKDGIITNLYNRHIIYFDHKIADDVSIYNKIITKGIIKDIKIGSLIYNYDKYKPFYKSINYTVNNNEINDIFMIL